MVMTHATSPPWAPIERCLAAGWDVLIHREASLQPMRKSGSKLPPSKMAPQFYLAGLALGAGEDAAAAAGLNG